MNDQKVLRILGIRGLPAAHGGFETFAEHCALYLVERGWRVIVYCQVDGDGTGPIKEDTWRGIERVLIPSAENGVATSVIFDWKATKHAAQFNDLCMTLGYNTAAFCARLRLKGIPNVINMDGIEWSRAKWGPVAKAWFWMNDWAGCWLGNHLVADHPEIKNHLMSRVRGDKITTIAYGADPVLAAPEEPVRALGLEPGRYMTLIARPEPENSILDVVQGFSARPRGVQLVVLGNYDQSNAFHRTVLQAAGPEVKFVGAIYDKAVVQALRFHSLAYVHGHQVGGTNPSLVEALGAGNAVIAHNNRFNKWVAGPKAHYFSGGPGFDSVLTRLLAKPEELAEMGRASRERFDAEFTWQKILGDYERLLLAYLPQESNLAKGASLTK
jgi:glycosyltransferase involved in cell wall biosynthesis